MKKIIAVLLCLVMIFSLSSVAFAAEASTADQIRGAVRQNIITSTKVFTTFAKEAAEKVADYAEDNEENISKVVGDTVAGAIVYGTAKSAELVEFGADTANTVVNNTLNATANLPTEAVAAGAAAAAVAPVAGAAMAAAAAPIAAALIPASLAVKGLIGAQVATLAAVAAPLAIPAAATAAAMAPMAAAAAAIPAAATAAAVIPAALSAKGLIAAQVATVAALIPADLAAKTAAALAIAVPADLAAKTTAAVLAAKGFIAAQVATLTALTPAGLAFLIPATELVNGVLLRNSDLARSLAEKFAYPVERMIGSAIVKAQGMLADSVHKLDKIALAAINQNPALLNQPCTKAIIASQHMLAATLDRFDQFVVDFTDYTQPGLIVRPTPVHHHVAAPKTFDAGIALYVALGVMGVTGSAVVIGKKKEN